MVLTERREFILTHRDVQVLCKDAALGSAVWMARIFGIKLMCMSLSGDLRPNLDQSGMFGFREGAPGS